MGAPARAEATKRAQGEAGEWAGRPGGCLVETANEERILRREPEEGRGAAKGAPPVHGPALQGGLAGDVKEGPDRESTVSAPSW